MFGIKIKYVVIYSLILLLFPVLINFAVFSAKLPWVFGNADNWLSFWGNYTGGIISAIVAFIVTFLQIRNQRIIEKEKGIIVQLPALLRIEMEMEKFIDEIKRVKEIKENVIRANGGIIDFESDEEEKGISEYDLYNRQYKIESFDDEYFKLIEMIRNVNLHIQIVKCFQFYKEFSYALNLDIGTLNKRIDEIINIQLKNYHESNRVDKNNTYEANTINSDINNYSIKKHNVWRKLMEENIDSNFDQTLSKVKQEIEKVKRIMEEG